MWLVDYAADANAPIEGETPPPDRLVDGIELDTRVVPLSRRTEVDVLRDVSLHIPAGATVAIVGDNGAGKSTLVKLLCRFYDPTDGMIRVDGVDLRRIDPAKWRERLSAGFQDFAKFELIARETVGVGSARLDSTTRRPYATPSTGRRPTVWSSRCPTGSTPSSARASSAAPSCRAGSGRSWRWAGR